MDCDNNWIMRACKDNADAQKFLVDLWNVASIWDDLYDGDKAVPGCDLNRLMWTALVELPSNPFYMQFARMLQPVMRTAIISWMTSNSTQLPAEMRYTLRAMYHEVVITVALMVGGYPWAKEVSEGLWVESAKAEPFSQYLNEE